MMQALHPNDYVLLLFDWDGAKDTLKAAPVDKRPRPDLVDHWISPTSEDAIQKLKEWGLTDNDGSKLRFVSHSMGTLMASEISKGFGAQAKLFHLEPPRSLPGTSFDFNAKHIIDDRGGSKIFDTYEGAGSFTRAYYSIDSISANRSLAETADETIAIDYLEHTEPPDFVGYGPSHGWVQTTYLDLLTEQALFNDILNIRDLEENSIFQKNWDNGNEALLVTQKNDDGVTPGHIEYLIYQDNLGNINQFGSILNNYINPYKPNTEYHVYSSSGNDLISIKGIGASVEVYDYELGLDQLQLYALGANYEIEKVGNSIIIYEKSIIIRERVIVINSLSEQEQDNILVAFFRAQEGINQNVFIFD